MFIESFGALGTNPVPMPADPNWAIAQKLLEPHLVRSTQGLASRRGHSPINA